MVSSFSRCCEMLVVWDDCSLPLLHETTSETRPRQLTARWIASASAFIDLLARRKSRLSCAADNDVTHPKTNASFSIYRYITLSLPWSDELFFFHIYPVAKRDTATRSSMFVFRLVYLTLLSSVAEHRRTDRKRFDVTTHTNARGKTIWQQVEKTTTTNKKGGKKRTTKNRKKHQLDDF